MTDKELKAFKQWFSSYTQSFYSADREDQKNILLKVDHTRRVCKNIVAIARSESADDEAVRLAESIALFHDIGRFPQYARYKTFRDAHSKNHGLLGVETLLRQRVIETLPDRERDLIIESVKFHNAYQIPPAKDRDHVFFLKLIRDADKVDIYRIFVEYYESPNERRASATTFGVPDTAGYSKVMLSCIADKKVASYSNIKSENDFRLMKLSWVYDIHFDESLRLIIKRYFLHSIMNALPQTEEIRAAMAELKNYISQRLGPGWCKALL